MTIEYEDPPLVRLTNMLLLNMIKRGASHLRVRDGAAGGVEERHDGEWRHEAPTADRKLWSGVIARLKLMAGIDDRAVTLCGSRVRLMLGLDGNVVDFDVTLARTEVGSVIVLGLVPVSEQVNDSHDVDVSKIESRFATAIAASQRADHDAVRRELREAIELASALRSDTHASNLLRRAASIALWAGLEDVAIAQLDRVLELRGRVAVDPAQLVDVELALGDAHEALHRFDRALPHFERAMQAAEKFAPTSGLLVLALSSTGRACARCGDVSRAMHLLEQAEAVTTVLVGSESSLLMPRLELARVAHASDGAARVAATLRVLALAESFDDENMIESALSDLAEVELARGSAQAAAEYAKRALAISGAHPSALRTYVVRARSLTLQDKRSEALVVLRAGADIARTFRPASHPDRIAIERELADAEQSSPYR